MTQVINTNVLSLNAQRNLSTSGSSLATALQRLSSGLRINSAKDDAAGLAIAERFTTQIRGLNQAVRNANDGISLAQTGEGALAEITSNLQRVRELSVQAANSTNSASDRAALDQEVQQRLAEIQRVASQTSFNGQKILDGSFGNAAFQVGANAGETISINLSTSTQTTDIGQIATTTSGNIGSLFGNGLTLANGDLTVNGTSVAAGNFTDATTLAAAINTAYQTATNTNATVAQVSGNEISFSNSTNSAITLGGTANPLGITTVAAATTSGAGLTLAAGDLTVNGTDVTGTFTTSAGLASAINTAYQTATGTNGTIAAAQGNEVLFTNTSNAAVTFAGANSPLGAVSSVAAQTTVPAGVTLAAGDLTIDGTDITGTFTTDTGLRDAINLALGSNVASLDGNGELVLTNTTQTPIAISGNNNILGITSVAVAPGVTLASGDFTIEGQDITGTFTDVDGLRDAINALGISGVTATTTGGGELDIANTSGAAITVAGTFQSTIGIGGTINNNANSTSTNAAATVATSTTGTSTGVAAAVGAQGSTTPGTATTTTVAALVGAAGTTTNGSATTTGVNAAVTAVGTTPLTLATGDFTVQVAGGNAVDLAGSYANGQAFADAINAQVAGAFASFDSTSGQIALSSGQALTLGGARQNAGTGGNGLGFATSSVTVTNGSLSVANVTTAANANSTILRVDAALTSIGGLRGALGAIQNRFESTITNLTTASENLTASRSRIQDADFAAETASLTRAQILQQAGTAILAQANAVPQNVLSLLR